VILTGKNKMVFDFMLASQREHSQGRPPSLREIARGCGLGSAAAAQYHAKKLVDMGMAEATGDGASRYRVLDTEAELVILQRAATRFKPEQIFSEIKLYAWAMRAGLRSEW